MLILVQRFAGDRFLGLPGFFLEGRRLDCGGKINAFRNFYLNFLKEVPGGFHDLGGGLFADSRDLLEFLFAHLQDALDILYAGLPQLLDQAFANTL